MFTGPLEDRIAIRELNDLYGDGVVRNDPETWGSIWAEDATWHFMGQELEGREAIVGLWNGAMSNFEAVSFSCSPAAIEVDGDTATARVQTQEILKGKDGSTRHIGGLYTDKLAKIDGEWRFTHRAWQMIAEFQPAEAA
ncbi:MAG: nuclear transport factor 2 family protein [Pseudomonadota bacterium]